MSGRVDSLKISIALAAYNGSAYIEEQLKSFVTQTRQPDELVIVDDHSSDGTVRIAEAFAEIAPFPVVIFVNDKNLGYAQNFDKALSLCSGDLVFLSDQDDVWFDRKIEKIFELAQSEPQIGCFMNDATLADEVLNHSGLTKLGQIRAEGLSDTEFVMGCCVALRRSLLDVALPIPQTACAHDNWIVGLADCLKLTHRMPVVLQYYRLHGANVSDFFINRVDKRSRWQALSWYMEQIKRRLRSGDSLAREYSIYSNLAHRISEKHTDCLGLVGPERIDEVENTLTARLEVLGERLTIRSSGFSKRPRSIATLLNSGGYRQSGGVLGALKDLLSNLL